MYRLKISTAFEAAHWIPGHPGRCANLHGHQWKAEVSIASLGLNAQGMVVDFGDIKNIIKKYDHKCLNNMPDNSIQIPTAENISKRLFLEIQEYLSQRQILSLASIPFCDYVSVWETEGNCATYSEAQS